LNLIFHNTQSAIIPVGRNKWGRNYTREKVVKGTKSEAQVKYMIQNKVSEVSLEIECVRYEHEQFSENLAENKALEDSIHLGRDAMSMGV
jgi:hypothetical protein